MSSTSARQRAGDPAVPEQAAPDGAQKPAGQALPARHDSGGVSGPAAVDLVVAGRGRRRRGWITVVVVVLVAAAAGAAGAYAAGAFRAPKQTVSNSGYGTRTAPVRRGSLTEQMLENGTLGDAGMYTVVVPGAVATSGATAGTFTWLPVTGQVIRQDQEIYEVSGTPVVLLYGNVPAYRDLSEGMTGADVMELNADLVSLGYATVAALGPRSGWDYFSGETGYALGLLQAHLGVSVTGTLPLGEVVFLPGPVRVTGLGAGAVPGGPAASGAVVLTGSSLTPVVTVDLDASLQTEVAVGSKVSVTLPDGLVTPGVISQVSTAPVPSLSSSSSPGNGSGPAAATIIVVVSLTDPAAAGNLNQAPVGVTITAGSVRSVLIVPVDALLARPGGGYAVEVTGPGGHHLVRVTTGLFDDAAGTVQVIGNLMPGQRVVVPGL